MQVEFNYPKLIGELNLEQKRRFYVLFAHNLTVSNRAIWSDENFTNIEKIDGMRLINEIMHSLVFRIEELHKISNTLDDSWTEEDFWKLIKSCISENYKVVAGNVGWAIKVSYDTDLKL